MQLHASASVKVQQSCNSSVAPLLHQRCVCLCQSHLQLQLQRSGQQQVHRSASVSLHRAASVSRSLHQSNYTIYHPTDSLLAPSKQSALVLYLSVINAYQTYTIDQSTE